MFETIISLLALFSFIYADHRFKKAKGEKYKAMFDKVWETRGYRQWMELRATEIKKGNKVHVAYSNDKFFVERIGSYLFYKEGHMFGDYHKIWHCK